MRTKFVGGMEVPDFQPDLEDVLSGIGITAEEANAIIKRANDMFDRESNPVKMFELIHSGFSKFELGVLLLARGKTQTALQEELNQAIRMIKMTNHVLKERANSGPQD
jgi:hypothetical protein